MLSPKMQRSIRINENQVLMLAEKARHDHNYSGYLSKRSSDSNKWQVRWFTLYQNLLFYSENDNSPKPSGVIMLEGCYCERLITTNSTPLTGSKGAKDNNKELFCFAITYRRENQRQYDLRAENECECKSWIDMIRQASFNKLLLQKEELEQKHLHLLQIVESEKTAKWQYTQQCEELTSEIKKLRAELCALKKEWRVVPSRRLEDLPEDSEEIKKIKKVQSFFRGWLCRRRWKQIVEEYIRSPHAESMRKRNSLVFRMVEAEEEYVEQLNMLISFFLRPFKMAASSKKPPCSHEDVNSIFLNSETLLFLHQIFLKGLSARMESWPTLVLGDLFDMLLPMLSIYQEYVRNHHYSLQVLAECKQNSHFAAFLNRLEGRPALQGRTLETFLTYPMHQIPRYIITLHELLAHTPHNHVERKSLDHARMQLEDLSRQMHDEVSETENIRKNLAIERMIVEGCDIILDVNQMFVRQGSLIQILEGRPRSNKPRLGQFKSEKEAVRQCFLFSNHLIVATRTSGGKLHLVPGVGKIPLQEATLIEDPNEGNSQEEDDDGKSVCSTSSQSSGVSESSGATSSGSGHGKLPCLQVEQTNLDFKIVVEQKNAVTINIHLIAPTMQEKQAWISDISQCLDNVHFNNLFRASISDTSSVTMPHSIKNDPRLFRDDIDIRFSRTLNSCKVPHIRYATPERLLERLTDLRFLSIDFLNTFLLTYRVFSDGVTVLEALKKVYYNPDLPEQTDSRDSSVERSPEYLSSPPPDLEAGTLSPRRTSTFSAFAETSAPHHPSPAIIPKPQQIRFQDDVDRQIEVRRTKQGLLPPKKSPTLEAHSRGCSRCGYINPPPKSDSLSGNETEGSRDRPSLIIDSKAISSQHASLHWRYSHRKFEEEQRGQEFCRSREEGGSFSSQGVSMLPTAQEEDENIVETSNYTEEQELKASKTEKGQMNYLIIPEAQAGGNLSSSAETLTGDEGNVSPASPTQNSSSTLVGSIDRKKIDAKTNVHEKETSVQDAGDGKISKIEHSNTCDEIQSGQTDTKESADKTENLLKNIDSDETKLEISAKAKIDLAFNLKDDTQDSSSDIEFLKEEIRFIDEQAMDEDINSITYSEQMRKNSLDDKNNSIDKEEPLEQKKDTTIEDTESLKKETIQEPNETHEEFTNKKEIVVQDEKTPEMTEGEKLKKEIAKHDQQRLKDNAEKESQRQRSDSKDYASEERRSRRPSRNDPMSPPRSCPTTKRKSMQRRMSSFEDKGHTHSLNKDDSSGSDEEHPTRPSSRRRSSGRSHSASLGYSTHLNVGCRGRKRLSTESDFGFSALGGLSSPRSSVHTATPRSSFQVPDSPQHSVSRMGVVITSSRQSQRRSSSASAAAAFAVATAGSSNPRDLPKLNATGRMSVISDDRRQSFKERPCRQESIISTAATMRVLNVLRHWVSKHWQDFESDSNLCQLTIEFLEDLVCCATLLPAEHKAASQLLRMITKEEPSTNRTDINSLLAPPSSPSAENIETLSAMDIAEQMTFLDHQIFFSIRSEEFLKTAWTKDDKQQKAPHILILTKRFNEMSRLVVSEVLRRTTMATRISVIEKWVAVADICRVLHNFNGVLQICSAFQNSSVFRLKKTWEKVSKTTRQTLEKLQNLVSADGRFRSLRDALHRCDPPCNPYLGMYLTDLSFIEEGTPNFTEDGLLNFSKMRMIAHVIREIRHFQQTPYKIEHNPRVCSYQLDMTLLLSDDDLYRLSLDMEPRRMTLAHVTLPLTITASPPTSS